MLIKENLKNSRLKGKYPPWYHYPHILTYSILIFKLHIHFYLTVLLAFYKSKHISMLRYFLS